MNQKQCKGCVYFRAGNGDNKNGLKFCHYMLYTDKRRQVAEDGKCLSYKKGKKTKPSPVKVFS